MSEPRIHTGHHEDRACSGCGAVVRHSEHVGMYGSGPLWSPARHEAPCGRPCLTGGVAPRDYRAGNVHRSTECSACEEATRG